MQHPVEYTLFNYLFPIVDYLSVYMLEQLFNDLFTQNTNNYLQSHLIIWLVINLLCQLISYLHGTWYSNYFG